MGAQGGARAWMSRRPFLRAVRMDYGAEDGEGGPRWDRERGSPRSTGDDPARAVHLLDSIAVESRPLRLALLVTQR